MIDWLTATAAFVGGGVWTGVVAAAAYQLGYDHGESDMTVTACRIFGEDMLDESE